VTSAHDLRERCADADGEKYGEAAGCKPELGFCRRSIYQNFA